MKRGKNYRNALAKFDIAQKYDLPKAVEIVKELKFAKFDETVEVHVSLTLGKGQSVRDTLVLPHQFRGDKKVLVFCTDDRVKEALDAGATYAGSTEYIDKIKAGWLDFDVAVATPDMMKNVGRLGMILGRRGLMPNPKTGTVTTNIPQAISELKKGRVEFRAERAGIVHAPIGRLSFDDQKLVENFDALVELILKLKPAAAKGQYVRSIAISSSMSPGVKLDPSVTVK